MRRTREQDVARVGLCEDDPTIRRVVTDAMRIVGHEVVAAHDGGEALRMFGEDDRLDVLILDIGLPDADGRDVTRRCAPSGRSTPVLFPDRAGVGPRPTGRSFSAGADDYLPKPFDVLELIARVEALARRGRLVVAEAPPTLVAGPAALGGLQRQGGGPADAHGVPDAGRDHVTPRRGRASRAVVAAAWPHGGIVSENTVDSYVRRIRIKLREVDSPLELTTVHRGVGFTLR